MSKTHQEIVDDIIIDAMDKQWTPDSDRVPPTAKNVIEPFKPNRHQRRKHKSVTTQHTHKHNEKARLAIYCKIIAGELK